MARADKDVIGSSPAANGDGDDSAAASVRHAMSVDVEDYFQVWAFSDSIARGAWDGFDRRVAASTRRCLNLFAEAGATATFFTLGWVAEREPALIRDIVAAGHELASHGYDHRKANAMTRAEFREDAAKTKAILEDIGGVAIRGYRAAGFSIDRSTPWAHDVLLETGHDYSSSAHPIAHDHYGDAGGPAGAHRPIDGSPFLEAPVATTSFLGRRISCAGGGWFRAMPFEIYMRLLKRAERNGAEPVIFYYHPWEIDPRQPRVQGASAKSRARHYLNLGTMEGKLARLLRKRAWRRVDETLCAAGLLAPRSNRLKARAS